MHHVHHVLRGQGLKIQLVRRGVVRGDRFGVVVDDNGLIAHGLDGMHRMDGGIVKLHALADADGAGAQDDDFLFPRNQGFVFFRVGGIKIGYIADKLTGAGVDHLVHREDVFPAAQAIDVLLPLLPQFPNIGIGKAQALGFLQKLQISRGPAHLLFKVHDLPHFIQEEHIDLGHVADQGGIYPHPQKLCNGINPVVGSLFDIVQELFHAHMVFVKLFHVQAELPVLQGADGLQKAFLKAAAHAHDLAGGLHLGGEPVLGIRELVKGEPGHFGDHIV